MDKNLRDKTQDLVSDLDVELGGIGVKVEDLQAIKTKFSSVMEELDNIDPADAAKVAYVVRHAFPTLRMMESLMRYSVKDLSEHCEASHELHEQIHNLLIKDE